MVGALDSKTAYSSTKVSIMHRVKRWILSNKRDAIKNINCGG